MKYSQAALDENRAAEEETKRMLQDYANHIRNRLQQTELLPESKQEPILPLAEAQRQLDEELYSQTNELLNKYPAQDTKRFAKTKGYLNKI
jgi:hypothetical protein